MGCLHIRSISVAAAFPEEALHGGIARKIPTSHNQTTRGPKCKGMEGLVKEGEMIEEEADDEVREAGLIPPPNVSNTTISLVTGVPTDAELLSDKKGRNCSRRTHRKSPIPTKSLPSLQLP